MTRFKNKKDYFNRDYRKLALLCIKISIVFALIIVLLFLFKTNRIDYSYPISTDIFADYGTLVGGICSAIFGIASVFLIIQSINDVRNNSKTDQIESRFFELLKIHRENRNEIISTSKEDAFVLLKKEYDEMYRMVENASSGNNFNDIDKMDITFLCFYYGVFYSTNSGNYSFQLVCKVLSKYMIGDNTFASKLLDRCADYNRIHNTGYFNGYQSRLGHYYRHLFQTVKYIDQLEIFDYRKKYHYLKTLRAQLSTPEQFLLAFNSLSSLGRLWEIDSSVSFNNKLITKYNFIKNIPAGIEPSYINIKNYYPDVHYEIDGPKTERRKELEKQYS